MSEDDPFDCFGSSSEEEDGDDHECNHDEDSITSDANYTGSSTTEEKNDKIMRNTRDDDMPSSSGKNSNIITRKRSRDPSCGICTFHPHTETSLLTHVRNSLLPTSIAGCDEHDNHNTSNNDDNHNNNHFADWQSKDYVQSLLNRSLKVLKSIDDYCTSRHWMMHIGPEKGGILTSALREALDSKMHRQREGAGDGKTEKGEERGDHSQNSAIESPSSLSSFVAVELGSYCGYAAILMAREYCQARLEDLSSAHSAENGRLLSNMNFHLFSMEINREYAEVAREMINLSGFEELISVPLVSFDGYETNLVDVITSAVQTRGRNGGNEVKTISKPMIDFLFIDHDKDSYKSDLCRLEISGMVRKGTKVVADNVLFAQIDDYICHVRKRQEEGVVKTDTIPCRVEYSCGDVEVSEDEEGVDERFGDGVGKMMFRLFLFYSFFRSLLTGSNAKIYPNLQKSRIT
ncbi:hypothetical protein ACHAXS_009167 [Conticribra weissflogii]